MDGKRVDLREVAIAKPLAPARIFIRNEHFSRKGRREKKTFSISPYIYVVVGVSCSL